MSVRIFLYCIIVPFLMTLHACKKDKEVNEVFETGAIAGTIKLYDDKTNSISNSSGVTVAVIGMPEKLAVTGADGQFRIEGLEFDNYNLSFSKTGYGTYKIYGIEHKKKINLPAGTVSVTQLGSVVNLGAVSGSSVTSMTAVDTTYNDFPGIEYSYSLNPSPSSSNRGYVRAFLGSKHTTSSTEYKAYASLKSVQNNDARGGFTAEDLYGFGFEPNDSVYVKIYGDAYFSNDYTDPSTGKRIFPNLNAVSPEPVSFIVP